MTIQLLVASMHQQDHSLLDTMNIQTDAIIGNQCDRNEIEDFDYHGHHIRYLSFAERGVGLNRNNALMRATGDICLFADDDMVFLDGYADVVENVFSRLPDADVIIFSLMEKNGSWRRNAQVVRVNYWNYLRYGAARIAIRLHNVRSQGICFNQYFGGGTEHRRGEDNLFLTDCLRKGLRIYAVPEAVAVLTDNRPSSWDKSIDEGFFRDTGVLYRTISRRWWRILCLQDAVRHAGYYKESWHSVYRKMTNI